MILKSVKEYFSTKKYNINLKNMTMAAGNVYPSNGE